MKRNAKCLKTLRSEKKQKSRTAPVRLSIGTSSWLDRGERLGQLIIENERGDNWVIRGQSDLRGLKSALSCDLPPMIFLHNFASLALDFLHSSWSHTPAFQPNNRYPEKIRMVSFLYSLATLYRLSREHEAWRKKETSSKEGFTLRYTAIRITQ